jgi:hypothetical protein
LDAVAEATAMKQGVGGSDTHDILVARNVGIGNNVFLIDNSFPTAAGPGVADSRLPTVDSVRTIGIIGMADVSVHDLLVSDTNNDGFADLTVISPDNYLVAKTGDGTGFVNFVIGVAPGTFADNTGALFPEIDGKDTAQSLVIRPMTSGPDQMGNVHFDQVAVSFNITRLLGLLPGTLVWNIADGPDLAGGGVNGNEQLTGRAQHNVDGAGLDMYQPFLAVQQWGTVVGESNDVGPLREIVPEFGFVSFVAEHYVKIQAGDGGNALVRKGGIGGSLGKAITDGSYIDPATGLTVQDLVGAISVILPSNIDYGGVVEFHGGTGGNGLSVGGKGGSVVGVTVRYVLTAGAQHSDVSVFAGDGGFGVSGAGGAGGDLAALSIQSGLNFIAGNGGPGAVGGSGGSIIGNGVKGFYDSENPYQMLIAGAGGNGVKAGGNGGSIINFAGLYDLSILGINGGLLSHIAGNGGNAISGPGGNGGNVINSSPLSGVNLLAGNITIIGGNGGNGKSGGNGGNVRNFVDRPSSPDNPGILTILGGQGGNASRGHGGNGGDISNIDAPSVGKLNPFEFPDQPYPYNRFLAGDGGKSAGGFGGNGGNVQSVTTSNSDNPFVMVSGAGGSGLYQGGKGGNLLDVSLSIGAESFNKGLFIAGAGGSAAAWIPNPFNDSTPNQGQKAFGGRVGRAGDGGSIVNLTQSGAIGARIDLIAGNGGDTINYGSVIDSKNFVGKGGSILNVHLDSNIGNIAPDVALKSYNDVLNGETVQDFVTRALRDPLFPGTFDDSVAMVGAVIGSAGRIKSVPNSTDPSGFRSQPANGGINGSFINVSARNIASAVAGAPERIASIQVVGNINITGGGTLGKDFDDTIDATKYRDPVGNPIPEPVLDGSLVDGALVYKNFVPQFKGDKLPVGHIFQLGGS